MQIEKSQGTENEEKNRLEKSAFGTEGGAFQDKEGRGRVRQNPGKGRTNNQKRERQKFWRRKGA